MAARNARATGDELTARACEAGQAALLASLAAALGYDAAKLWPAHSQLFAAEADASAFLSTDPCNPARMASAASRAAPEGPADPSAVWLIPSPPSLNNMFANSSAGRRKTRAYQQWRDGAMAAMVGQSRRRNFQPPYQVALWLHVGARSDVDNRIKAVLDLLQRCGIIDDDRHVDRVAAQRDIALPEGRSLVWLASIAHPGPGRGHRHG